MNKSIKKITLVCVFASVLTACASNNSSKPIIESAQAKPKDERALLHTRLAREYMDQEQYGIAKKELEKALLLHPSHSDSNYVMGLLQIQLKNNRDAEYYLRRAVDSDRDNASAAHDFGLFLCQTGKESESIKYFEIAARNPLFNRAELSYMRAGECLSRIGDPKAEKFLKRALEFDPKMRPALYRLAKIKQREGQNLSARAYIERYLAITNPQPEALMLAYEIESSLRAYDMAEKYRKQILETFPGSVAAETLRKSK